MHTVQVGFIGPITDFEAQDESSMGDFIYGCVGEYGNSWSDWLQVGGRWNDFFQMEEIRNQLWPNTIENSSIIECNFENLDQILVALKWASEVQQDHFNINLKKVKESGLLDLIINGENPLNKFREFEDILHEQLHNNNDTMTKEEIDDMRDLVYSRWALSSLSNMMYGEWDSNAAFFRINEHGLSTTNPTSLIRELSENIDEALEKYKGHYLVITDFHH